MKTKKIFLILAALCLVFFVAGCDNDSSSSNKGNNGGGNGNGGGSSFTGSYLCLKATGGSVDVKLKLRSINGTMSAVPSLEYSTDGSTWTAITLSNPAEGLTTENDITTLADGEKMYVRATSTNSFITEYTPSVRVKSSFVFDGAGTVEASGNVMSLVDKTCESTSIPSEGCFASLFEGCTNLVSPPELPATSLQNNCYQGMFRDCSSLAAAPALPATALSVGCYNAMFYGCTALTSAPVLPATTLTVDCYSGMFHGCTALTAAPVLPATTLAGFCYTSMFEGCTALTAAPELPAAILADSCYLNMFNGCTSLNSITVHFTLWDPADATIGWVNGMSNTAGVTFTCPSTLNTDTKDVNHVLSNWTLDKSL
ncbi:MAG: hypothetical protein IKZ57_03115 [Spirochaetia bacterium]|nr:hypothetical protein [Spirochaetia bacterium]